MPERTRPWLLGLTLAFALGVILGAATVSRGTAGRGGDSALENLAAHVTVVNGPLNGVAGPHIIFEGVNVHIRSGSGATDDGSASGGTTTGLGNLIIGYNALPAEVENALRGGSHTLVIGDQHQYSSWGGLVAGAANTISAGAASVSGGTFNAATNIGASVSGGTVNTASGLAASVTGGSFNTASGENASISGGYVNIASGTAASLSGRHNLTANNNFCWRVGTLNEGCTP